MAIGVDVIVVVIVVVVVVIVVNFCCPLVAIKSWQHDVTWVISVYDSNSNKEHVTQ